MTTRFYLPSTGAAPVTPAYDVGWEDTSFAARLKAITTKISSAFTTIADTVSIKTNQDHLYRQWVSDPIPAGVISAQTIKVQIRAAESNTSANLYTSINIRVVSNDGNTFRTPAIVAMQRDDVEWASSLTNRGWSGTSSEVTASANDRIVIELGQGGDPTGGGNHNDGTMRIGDNSGTDLPEDDTDTNDYCPWVEFAQALFPTIYYQTNEGAITPAGNLVGKALKKLAGALTFVGTLTKRARKKLAGEQTFAGNLAKKSFWLLEGAQTFIGTLATQTRFTKLLEGAQTFIGTLSTRGLFKKALAGAQTFVGDLKKKTSKSFAGAQTFVGTLKKKSFEALAGAVTFDGTLTKKTKKLFEGAQTFVGTLKKKSFEVLAGAMTFDGTLTKRTKKLFEGAMTFIGTLDTTKLAGIFYQLLEGAITPAGALTTKALFKKALAGAMTFAGDLTKKTQKLFVGAITPSGTLDPLKLGGLFFKSLAGAIAPSGSLVPKTLKKLYGTIAPAGGLSLKTLKKLAGSIALSGVLSTIRTRFRTLSGAITFDGVITKRTRKLLLGVLTFTGGIRKKTSTTLTGSITPTGSISKKMFLALSGAISFVGSLVGIIVDTEAIEFIPQTVVETGITPVFNTASGGGNFFYNNGITWIHVRNGATDVNITFETFYLIDNHPFVGVPLEVDDRIVNVPAGEERVIGIFPPYLYNEDIIDNTVRMTYDSKENVTIAVLTHEFYWEA